MQQVWRGINTYGCVKVGICMEEEVLCGNKMCRFEGCVEATYVRRKILCINEICTKLKHAQRKMEIIAL